MTHERLLELGSSTVFEAQGRHDAALPADIRPVWRGAKVSGPAYPLRCAPGDNLAIHHALLEAPRGSVLVIEAAGACNGYWGEVLTVQAQAQGISGLIINGGVRDIDAMEARGFPVFARWISVRGTAKACAPTWGEPTQVAGVEIAPADMIVADTDGVVVVPMHKAAEVLQSSEAREAKEREMMKKLNSGASTLELMGLSH